MDDPRDTRQAADNSTDYLTPTTGPQEAADDSQKRSDGGGAAAGAGGAGLYDDIGVNNPYDKPSVYANTEEQQVYTALK
jgi:hypothetical protein